MTLTVRAVWVLVAWIGLVKLEFMAITISPIRPCETVLPTRVVVIRGLYPPADAPEKIPSWLFLVEDA